MNFNFKQGSMTNMQGECEDIIVEPRMKFRDYIGGGLLILAGINWIVLNATRRGSQAHEAAEFETMKHLDIIDAPENEHVEFD